MKISPIEVTLVDYCGSDLSVVNAARVSFHKESKLLFLDEHDHEGYLSPVDEKLINYLAKHKHHSPFNHAFISVRVKAPIFVARQLVKHKFLPWNEVSRRYVDDEPEFYLPDDWRKRSENVKQGSSDDFIKNSVVSKAIHVETCWDEPGNYDGRGYAYQTVTELCFEAYDELLKSGVCPEQARMVLPQNTMTEWYWSGTLGAFGDMLKLRLDPHTQKETRDVAELIKGIAEPLFPVSLKAMLET